MMHLAGMAEKEGHPIRTLHFVQILRDALKNVADYWDDVLHPCLNALFNVFAW